MQAQGMWSAGEGDDKERFLADLRGLRDTAALEFDELAARAHYPSDVLKEAACGPSLPSLPILAAYVRACDGDVPEWEERWRRLGFESRADPSLPVRPAGASPAAVAGARAAVSVAPPDAYDPERIRAALRGSHGRSDRGASGAATQAAPRRIDADIPAAAEPRIPESPASWAGGTSWDAGARWDAAVADLTSTPTNGNHHASQPGEGSSDAAVIETHDAARADTIRRDPFSADWLRDGELTSPPATEPARPGQAGDEPSAAASDSWFKPRDAPDRAPDAEPSPGAADAWFTPRERADSGPPPPSPSPSAARPQESAGSAAELVTGFWTPSAGTGRPTAEGHAIPRASRPEPAATPASDTPAAAGRTTPGPVLPPSRSRTDRLYPVRLLVVIVIAALIGSILVLLLR